jgi:hypothetical protein
LHHSFINYEKKDFWKKSPVPLDTNILLPYSPPMNHSAEPPVIIHNDLPNSEGIGLLYNSDHHIIGEIHNYYAFLDVRIQIQQKKLNGYYMILKGVKTTIESDGKVRSLFPSSYKLLDCMLDKVIDF